MGFSPLAREPTNRMETPVPGIGALGENQVRGRIMSSERDALSWRWSWGFQVAESRRHLDPWVWSSENKDMDVGVMDLGWQGGRE